MILIIKKTKLKKYVFLQKYILWKKHFVFSICIFTDKCNLFNILFLRLFEKKREREREREKVDQMEQSVNLK